MNWRREKEQSRERAIALASIVFPTPGKSSMIRCPSLTRQRTQSRSVSAGAWMTLAEVLGEPADRRRPTAAVAVASLLLHQTSRSTSSRIAAAISSFGALSTRRSPVRGEDHDLVLGGVEAHVVSGYVVVDDQVDALRRRASRARARARPRRSRPRSRRAPGRSRARSPSALEDVCRRLELDRPRLLRPSGAWLRRFRPAGSPRRPRP